MKKGFTLIELISVIIIIGVIALISVPITINITNNAKNKAYKETIDSIELSAYNYSVYNDLGYNRLFKSLPISTIKLAGYLDNEDIIDPRNNDIIDGCVMYRYIPNTKTYELFYSSTCDEKKFYPEVTINVLNDNNKDWLNEKIKFTISGEYGQFKYCIGKNECNPDIYYNGETTLDTEGTNLIICTTGYFDEEVGLSTCTKLYNIDYTKPTLTYTTPMKTNKITISANCSDSISGVASTLYSLDGSSYTNKYVYTNIEYKEHNVSVKCTDVAGNVTVVDKKVTPPKITPPEITQISWYPNTTWAQWRIYKIKFNTGENDKNIENPYYYFKYTVKANLTEGNIVEQCGTGTKPSSCSSTNTTTIEPNTWYRTNNKEIKVRVDSSKENNIRGVNAGTIYSVIYDGTNLSTTSTGMINYMDKENPEITSINSKLYTNKINVISVCQDQTGLSGIREILYSLDGSSYQQSNVFSNVKEGTHTVKVKCIDNALNEVEQSKNITPPKIVNPAISQYSQSPSGTWAQNRVVKISYDNTNIETPYYYFKSQVTATVASGVVVQNCGTGNTPSTCTTSNITELAANTWYRTNNKEILLTYKENIVKNDKILYAITYDGTNLSGTATHTIGLIDTTKPGINFEITGTLGNNGWYIGNVVGKIVLTNSVPSGVTYYYGTNSNPTTIGTTFTHTENTKNITYYAKICSGSQVCSDISYKTFKIDKTLPDCITKGESTSWTSANRVIYSSCSDSISGCATSDIPYSFTTSVKTYTIPSYTIKDNAGNSKTCPAKSINVYIDKETPQAPTLQLVSNIGSITGTATIKTSSTLSGNTTTNIQYGTSSSLGGNCAAGTSCRFGNSYNTVYYARACTTALSGLQACSTIQSKQTGYYATHNTGYNDWGGWYETSGCSGSSLTECRSEEYTVSSQAHYKCKIKGSCNGYETITSHYEGTTPPSGNYTCDGGTANNCQKWDWNNLQKSYSCPGGYSLDGTSCKRSWSSNSSCSSNCSGGHCQISGDGRYVCVKAASVNVSGCNSGWVGPVDAPDNPLGKSCYQYRYTTTTQGSCNSWQSGEERDVTSCGGECNNGCDYWYTQENKATRWYRRDRTSYDYYTCPSGGTLSGTTCIY